MRFWKDFKSICGPLAMSLVLVFFLAPRPLEEARPVDAAAEIEAPETPLVALTFDDGPNRSTTTKLLDGLAQRGVKCTFFIVGEMIPGNEDLIERMAAEGHQIGVHSYDHVYLTGLSSADFQAQVGRDILYPSALRRGGRRSGKESSLGPDPVVGGPGGLEI